MALFSWANSLYLPTTAFKSLLMHLPEGFQITLQNPPSYVNLNNPANNVVNIFNPYTEEL